MLSAALGLMVAALLVLAAAQLAAVVKGSIALRRRLRASSQDFDSVLLKSAMVHGVSVVCVADDASPPWRAHVRRLLDLHFGSHEVVLVVDETAGWSEELRLEREERTVGEELPGARVRGYYLSRDPIRVLVVEVEASGAAQAWNAGVNAAQYPVIGLVDREAEFIPEILLRLIRPMLQEERVLAVCGLAPGPAAVGLVGRMNALHTLGSWLEWCGRFGERDRLALLPGAGMLVKRETIVAAGGIGEKSRELFLDLPAQRRVEFVPAAVSCRRAATGWADVRRQWARDRWHTATVLPALLETLAYLLAAAGVITGTIPWALAGLVLLSTAGAGLVISMAAVVLREMAEASGLAPDELAALFFVAIAENLGYRPVRNLWIGVRFVKRHFGARPVH